MEVYGKVFRKYSHNELNIFNKSYNPEKEKYHEVILEMKSRGYKQVIINSELMVRILNEIILNEGFILQIKFTDNTDENLIVDVTNLIKNIRHNPIQFINLKEKLDWALDNNSIDIFNVELLYKNNKYTVYSNGLIMGNELNVIYEEIVKKILIEYLS
ncbi:hypothetical protein [Paenisporosarcina sp. TG-14]|uniref:hypothetical protein n=1 Tax=Paenisporosarcina sp. TG-14 TaxID=1231057 RepID=UPI00031A8DD2|nr:hypothetical protein [Paenisporosarcina sp. TG-14]